MYIGLWFSISALFLSFSNTIGFNNECRLHFTNMLRSLLLISIDFGVSVQQIVFDGIIGLSVGYHEDNVFYIIDPLWGKLTIVGARH